MNNRTLWIGAGVLAALCAAYFGLAGFMNRSEEKEAMAEEARTVYVTDMEAVSTISFEGADGSMEFAREGDSWYFSGDREFPVNQQKVNDLVSEAAKLKAERVLEQGEDISYYGLDNPGAFVTLKSQDGSEITVLIGNSLEGGGYYAMKEGEAQAYTVGAALPEALEKGLYDFIKLEEFPNIEGADIRQITITEGDSVYHYEKKTIDDQGNIAWYEGSSAAEENRMEDNGRGNTLADAISDLYVQECVNYKTSLEELADFGLDQPNAVIWYSYEDAGQTKNLKLAVGSLNEEGTYYFTRREGSEAVNRIEKSVIDKCLNVE